MEIVGALVKTLEPVIVIGGVWEGVAARSAKTPYIIVTSVSASSEYTHDKLPCLRTGTVDVKVITEGESFLSAENIRTLFDEAIHNLNNGNSYGIQAITREAEIRYIEFDKDVRYNHLGWTYRYMMAEPGQES